jgi:plastocyanin
MAVEQDARVSSGMRSKPFAAWVIAGGLVFSAIAIFAGAIGYAIRNGVGDGVFYSYAIFAVIPLIPAIFAWREKRWAYITATVVSLLFLVLFAAFSFDSLFNPADANFTLLAALVPALVLVVVFGILAFRSAKTGLRQKAYLASARSTGGLLTLAFVGFVLGMLVAGTIGAGVILRNTTGVAADIKIVANAMNAAVPYSPATFTVAVGRTVTWINLDTTAHTVTSKVAGQFDSGSISTGQTWSWTFTQAGTYHYFCSFHPQMTGTIIVQ